MRVSITPSIESIAPEEWDRVAGASNPFVRHAFLAALEASGCLSEARGWRPQHLLLHSPANGGQLLGAVPLYLKYHSYGEYVFDWAWADAYRRAGLDYYPKLVAAVPFTPAAGPRLLCAGENTDTVRARLVSATRELAGALGVSSLHWLFTSDADTRHLEGHGLLRRNGYQFHWHNRDYLDFDDFLAGFSADKRKKLRRERRQVREAGITYDFLEGPEITAAHWDVSYEFYLSTIHKHGGRAYLTRAFFTELGRRMPESLLLILARRAGEYVAGAFFVRGADSLYGRYWGASADVNSLHFETCYYAAIDYCIARKIARFEAGAQGEHKLARGFLPAATHSMHWLSHPEFQRAVENFLQRERSGVECYMDELEQHSPFKRGVAVRA